MQVTYYGRFHGPETGRIYAEIYKSSQDDGLTLDERVEARRFWTLWGAKRWIDKTILKLCCDNPEWYYVEQEKLVNKKP